MPADPACPPLPRPASRPARLGWQGLPDALTPPECGRLITFMNTALAARTADAAALAQGRRQPAIRRADIVWLTDGPETGWVMMRLAELVARANRERFGFALDGFDEAIQLTRYSSAIAGFYDWHVDRGASGLAARRKLSITIQLDPPGAYEGGGLELNVAGHPIEAPREQGAATVFPSFALHRVTPVTAGVRHALVGWIHGPDFV